MKLLWNRIIGYKQMLPSIEKQEKERKHKGPILLEAERNTATTSKLKRIVSIQNNSNKTESIIYFFPLLNSIQFIHTHLIRYQINPSIKQKKRYIHFSLLHDHLFYFVNYQSNTCNLHK